MTLTAPTTPTFYVKNSWVPDELKARTAEWSPKTQLGRIIKENLKYLPPEAVTDLLDQLRSVVVLESKVAAVVIRGCPEHGPECYLHPFCNYARVVEDHGVVSTKKVTTAGVNFIVDAFQNTTELENLKYHGIGTGVAAESNGDTALGTELTTEYNPNSTRATGSTTEGASANIYRTLGTNTLDSGTPAITEHGVFSATTAGTLLDRSVFSAINLVGTNGDGLQTTYDLTCSAEA